MLNIRYRHLTLPVASAFAVLAAGPLAPSAFAQPPNPQPPTRQGPSWSWTVGNPTYTGGQAGSGAGGAANAGGAPAPACSANIAFCNGRAIAGACIWTVACPGAPAGAPAITPQMLLQQAMAQLRPPAPRILTAPPRGKNGVVGLPEWFWLDPATAGPISKRLAVGPVWVEVTASPQQMSISPGAGLAPVVCPGSGTAYSAGAQSSCTYTYIRSSAGQPGDAYSATVTVSWGGTWRGSGGVGGALVPIPVTDAFTLRVAEGQALAGSGGSR